MKKIFFAILLSSSQLLFAADSFLDSVKRTEWGDLEVVWIRDDRFPKFTASIYFKNGAYDDAYPGQTQATMDLLTAGTPKFSQNQISEFFDFYGAKIRNSVTHEYSVLSIQGLTRDMKPLMGKVCELMNEASYPNDEVSSYVSRARSGLKNLVTSHASLADRIFRQVSLQGTPFDKPVEGTYESLGKVEPANLKSRLQKLNDSKKTLYVSGPEDIKEMKKYLSSCQWKNEISLPDIKLKKPSSQLAIYLVPVPSANQAQIRIGRYITESEVQGKYDNFQLLAGFLGGSFTSKLVQELRVKRGLTYSAGAYASLQRDYGRAGIMTFTKNETAAETIKLIRDIFADVSAQKFSIQEFKHQQGHQIGSHAFGFEEMSAFIGQLIQYDHQSRDLSELAEYPDRVGKLSPNDLAWANKVSFPWERLTIVVVGDKSLEKSLSVIRPVRILDYKDFL